MRTSSKPTTHKTGNRRGLRPGTVSGIPNGHVQIKSMMTTGDTAFYINQDETQVYREADLRVSASYIANCKRRLTKWTTPPTGSRLKLQIADIEPRSSAASSIEAEQHRRSDTPLVPRTTHTSEGSSSSSRSLAGPGSGLFEDSEDGGKVGVSDVRVPVRFAAGMKLLFMSNVDAHLAAPIEDRYFLVAPVDDEDGGDHCVGVRAVKGGGVFLLDGDKSRAQVSASGVPVRYAVPFASWLDHGYKEQVVFLGELRLSQVQVRSKNCRAKRKRARSPKPDFQHGL